MFQDSIHKLFGYRHKIHLLNLLSFIGSHIFLFIGLNMALSAGVYFVSLQYSHQDYMTANLIFCIVLFTLLLSVLIPIALFLLSLCEMFAEYLACLLLPRQQ